MLIIKFRHFLELEVFGECPEELLERELIHVSVGECDCDVVIILEA